MINIMSTQVSKNLKYRQKKTPMHKRMRNYYKGGRQLVQDVAYLKGLINTEFKYRDVFNAGTTTPDTITTSGTFYLLNGLAESADYNGRVGRTIRIKSIQVRCEGVKNSNAAAVATDVRVILFWDMQPNGASPTLSTLLDNAYQESVHSFRNLNYRHRYHIIRDKRVRFDVDDVNKTLMDEYIKVNKKIIYGGTGANVADIITGSLYLLVVGNETTYTPTQHFVTRIRYVDN